MDRAKEFEYILAFTKERDFDEEVEKKQLQALWTAYCLHHGLDVDTAGYDNDLLEVWNQMGEADAPHFDWRRFDDFDLDMGEYLC